VLDLTKYVLYYTLPPNQRTCGVSEILSCIQLVPFDIITMNMVIMDIPTIVPLAAAVVSKLTIAGRFVASP